MLSAFTPSSARPKYNYIPLGAEGYGSKGVLNFFQDRYYVKLAGTGARADALLNQLAHTLSARIAGNRTLPPVLSKLLQFHRVRHSEQYIRKDPLGHPFLRRRLRFHFQGEQNASLGRR